MRSILITGAGGFIGSRLCALAELHGYAVLRVVRVRRKPDGGRTIVIPELTGFEDWPRLVSGVQVVIHLAARAHEIGSLQPDADDAYRAVNVEVTRHLAMAAANSDVSRFVFLSSIGVNGPATRGRAFTEADAPAPAEPYAVSKWEAEQALAEVASRTRMQVVVVRPPLVYGPGARGNLLRLLQLVARGVPLPLGGLRRPRSLIARDNLCDLLLTCVEHPGAANEVFLAAEPERRSTAELAEAISSAMGFRHQIFRLPEPILSAAATLLTVRPELEKMRSELQLDARKAQSRLGWRPRVTFEEEIGATVRWFSGTTPP
jgi:nucleoside-diphosphate-sugar epimerase